MNQLFKIWCSFFLCSFFFGCSQEKKFYTKEEYVKSPSRLLTTKMIEKVIQHKGLVILDKNESDDFSKTLSFTWKPQAVEDSSMSLPPKIKFLFFTKVDDLSSQNPSRQNTFSKPNQERIHSLPGNAFWTEMESEEIGALQVEFEHLRFSLVVSFIPKAKAVATTLAQKIINKWKASLPSENI